MDFEKAARIAYWIGGLTCQIVMARSALLIARKFKR